MTDEQQDPIANLPPRADKPKSKPVPKRANGMGNPPSEPSLQAEAVSDTPPPWFTAWLASQQQTRTSQFVAGQPDPSPQVREAADEELTEWQLRVRDKTGATPMGVTSGERNYNYPLVWMMKPDGSVVQLQGDPGNFRYYTLKKHFHALSEAEVKEWLTVEQPKLYALQRAKAHLITTLRRTVDLDPALKAALDPSWDLDLSAMTIPELQAQLEWIAGQPMADGRPRRILERLPRLQDAESRRAESEAKRLLEGVETSETVNHDQFLNSLERARHSGQAMSSGQGRTIEVTPQNVNQFR